MRGKTDKQGQVRSLGPANRSTCQCGALCFLSLSVDLKSGPPVPLLWAPRPGQSPPFVSCWAARMGLAMYLPPGADSEKAGRTRREEEGGQRRLECPQEPWVGAGRDAQGGTESRNSREKHAEGEGGREREETSYIHTRG